MITIFIPVLFMCISGNCNFMQAEYAFKTETACKTSIVNQITIMTETANEAKQKFDLLEGTCVSIRIEKPSVKV